ncbi:hypothetical protein DQ04_00401000 [Trypanosoma grayi]|uniref:hypothetical protein n=1 Tax=Trypanosoma grayi TaxID=71804 RepID=UPI0004F40C19|nr:hypothetical protein DQ04_00401000 [Trypanosoma grayi]KEG14560.1 hypothetical protein DQ04_00401000 [Trypanosoma grayi]
MSLNEVTSGYFGDVPYCSPVESSIYLDVLTSARIHRVPESMMTKADAENFFVDSSTQYHSLVLQLNNKADGATSRPNSSCDIGVLDAIPPLFQSPSVQRIFREDEYNNCFVTIESKEPSRTSANDYFGTKDGSPVHVVSLDLKGIDNTWQSLLSFLLGDAPCEKGVVYLLPSLDAYLHKGDPYSGFMFSLWALGISSILHHFASNSMHSTRQRLNKVSICITVLEGAEGESVADDVHLFLENRLRICVSRANKVSDIPSDTLNVDSANVATADNREEWLEKATEMVVGIHEELCDVDEEDQNGSDCKLRCILFVIPEVKFLRRDLERYLCDSYTSIPIVVVTEEKQIRNLLLSNDRRTPITLFCSQQKIEEELRKPDHERFLNHLTVKAIFYGEANRCDREIAIIRLLLPGGPLPVMLPHPLLDSADKEEHCDKLRLPGSECFQEAMNVVLWLFRRFRLDLSRGGTNPVLHISEMFFVSRGAVEFFENVMKSMKAAGLVCFVKQSDGSNAYRLEVLGRTLSYRFRLPYEPLFPEFTPFDVKCILWCHAFRQSRATAQELICAAHFLPTWVEGALQKFFSRHRITLENEVSSEEEAVALVQHLSSVPKYGPNFSRVKTFLSHPSGERVPISKHFTGTQSTSCRGWFEQAPISRNPETIPRPHVNVYCYPSSTELCEVRFGGETMQCPLDLSYPLIATHIALHTTLWNNGVFLEYYNDSSAAPLLPIPSAVLQSPTLRSFLNDVNDGNVGFWLDNCMDSGPALSDPLVLASLMSKAHSLLGLCDHGALRRKRLQKEAAVKRQKCEVKADFKTPSEAEAATIREFANAAIKLGRENAEKRFTGMRGFAFLNPSHENHAYYIHVLEQSSK